MTIENFEKSLLFLYIWREASHFGEQAMLAIAYALRNRQRAGWEGGSWTRVIEHADRLRYNAVAPNTGYPDPRDPIVRRVLARIDTIYDGSAPDTLTSCPNNMRRKIDIAVGLAPDAMKTGKYWCELDKTTNQEFLEKIVRDFTHHPKTSTVAGLAFFS